MSVSARALAASRALAADLLLKPKTSAALPRALWAVLPRARNAAHLRAIERLACAVLSAPSFAMSRTGVAPQQRTAVALRWAHVALRWAHVALRWAHVALLLAACAVQLPLGPRRVASPNFSALAHLLRIALHYYRSYEPHRFWQDCARNICSLFLLVARQRATN